MIGRSHVSVALGPVEVTWKDLQTEKVGLEIGLGRVWVAVGFGKTVRAGWSRP